MKSLTFKLGGKCWIHTGEYPDNPLKEGTIVHVFELYGRPHYVVEIETYIDPMLYVCEGITMSDTKKGPVGLWRGLNTR